jgi:hypothetical protein
MSKLDVLMVTPPSRLEVYQGLSTDYAAIEPPVWSGLIAEFLRRKGYAVAILDAEAEGYTHEQTAQAIVASDPRLAVFAIYGQQPSASTQCMPGGRKTCALLNTATRGEIPTLALGTHPSALPRRTLSEEPYTYVCQGEGPMTVQALVDALKGDGDVSRVPGLWYRDADGDVRMNAPAPIIDHLDDVLPRQAWDLLDMTKYRAHNWHCFHDLAGRGSYASLQTSLGCPFKCSFCCINAPFGTNKIRHWSPDNVIGQIDVLVRDYGVKNIKIPDEMFVLNPRQVVAICDRIIARGYDLNIWAYARIDTLNDLTMLAKLKRAGFNWLGLGIESGSSHVRDGVTKGRFGNIDIAAVVRRVRDVGISVGANYIFGLPDDTFDSMQETLDMALGLNTEWANFYSAMAYPCSGLYPLAKQRGWALPDDPGGPGWIGYAQHAYECLPLPTEHLSAQQVLRFRDTAFNAYFRSADYLALIRGKFGDEVRDHVQRMTALALPRRYHDKIDAVRATA